MRKIFFVAIVVASTAVGRGAPGDAAALASLSTFFKPGGAFQDRNGDGVVDFVDARIVLPQRASAAEIAAAADVAARLGYETTAMNLPLPEGGKAAVSVFIGARSLARGGVTADAIGVGPLKAGDGVVAAFTASGAPAVALLGGDDAGLAAAAVMFAGHLPNVWDQKGPTAETIADDVTHFLAGKGVSVTSMSVPAVHVRAGSDGIDRIVCMAQMANAGDLVKAQVALNQFKATGARDPKRAMSYAKVRSLQIRLGATGVAAATIDVPRAAGAELAAAQPPARRPGGGAKENLDLSSFYTIDGALADSDNNLIPDRVDVLLSADGEGTDGVVDLAARLGLESTGISVPIAKTAKLITSPESEPILVLIGTAHPIVEQLIEKKKMERPSLQPGEGLIRLVKKAFGEKSAIVVTGGDAAGVERAVHQLAEKFPHIWERGKDRTTLDDVEDELRKFIAGRSPSGQAAMSLYKLEKLADQLNGKDLTSATVKVFVEKADPRLADVVKETATERIKAGSLSVELQNLDVQKGRTLIEDEFDVPSEVDEFWTRFRARVLPAVKKRQPVSLEARLSEPPEIRHQIEQQARADLIKAGADDKATTVTVLSAYKQGYSWLYDVVRPALTGKAIDQITIRFAEIGPPTGWKQQGMFAPTRWLLELYPIDEILAAELKIELSQIRFEMAPIGSPAYEVVATAKGGGELLRRTFEPAFVERPFFDRFPDYERVRVTTGWIKADIAGRTAVDERIVTDPERFWDRFQSKTLPALYDHVMALGSGKPRPEDAPFFGELTVDVSLSEPEYRLPIDQEQISSMEALHEEIYFNTLHFFDVMGRFTRGGPLTYPGRVIPLVHPKSDGKAGHAKISVTGFDAPRPSVVAEYVERSGRKGVARLDIPKVALDRPQTLAATVRAGQDGVERLDLRVKVDTERDERDALVQRTDERRVDTTMMSAEQARAVIANLGRLRGAGLYRDALAYHDLGALRVTIAWQHESTAATEVIAALDSNGTPAPFPDIRKATNAAAAGAAEPTGKTPLVQWDAPIPPPEAAEILARMASFKEAAVYKVGQSYLGKDVWAMDLMPPIEASHWSQAKQTTMKPTIVYSARQHANEVSSTSHVLRMAELLLTDPAYKEKLKKVNVVVHPITNADGAQLAYDLQKVNPTHMLHAGYLGALGVDVTSAQWDADPLYPESGIRPKIWRTWLPDIFLNPHGYPSHEWVQLFSEYAAWVRTRSVETRDYWTMRGWWMPGFGWLDDARYPRHKDEQMKLLDTITEYVKQVPGTVALNERAYARYKRYSFDFDRKNFKLDFTNGVLIYKSIKGARANPQSQDFMTRNPNVTIWDGVTEAPDETARGDWLKLVANAGLQWDKAILEYLVQGHHEVERTVTPFWNGVSLTMNRPRPPKTDKDDAAKTSTQESR
ncbi:MAG TPA: M14 family metallopeptidase [Vicinamibacterales bacterium]|nr:M14 family metallopeptidase [Vicinamibacterales bacterium]